MRSLINQYEIAAYYFITLLLSGLLLTLHFVFQDVGCYSVSFPQLSPAIAVLLLALKKRDTSVLREISRHISFTGIKIKDVLFTLLTGCFLILSSHLILTKFGVLPVSWSGSLGFYFLNLAAGLIGCTTEEIGWRGFLQPQLHRRFSPLKSSIIVGILWGIWHLNFNGGILGFLLYTLTCAEMSVIMTWIYVKTGKNLLFMFLFHFSINLFSRIFLWERFGLTLYLIQGIFFGLVCIFIVILEQKAFLKRPN